jgi:hypothetical protein
MSLFGAARRPESHPLIVEVELPEVFLLQNVAEDGHPRPLALLHAYALDTGRHVDHVALRRRLKQRRPRELHCQLRDLLRVGTSCRPVVAVLERVHAHLGNPGEVLAQRTHHGLVRRAGEHRQGRAGVEDHATVPLDIPDLAGDVERDAGNLDSLHRHGVERQCGVEQQRRLVGRWRGIALASWAEGDVASDVARGEVVDEAVGEAAAEARSGLGRERDLAVAEAEHAVRRREALAGAGEGAAQDHAFQRRVVIGGEAGRGDGRQVSAHNAARRRRAFLVPGMSRTRRFGFGNVSS